MLESFIRGAAIGGVVALVVLIVGILARPQLTCPKCNAPLPKLRKPESFKQLLWGGYTCKTCGAQLTARGELRGSAST